MSEAPESAARSRCAGILLTGGASRRMGTDKALIEIRGETLAARAARALAQVCNPVIEVGPGVSGLRCAREDPPGTGPLAALVAGADALATTPVLLLAVDLPSVEPPLLRLIAEWPGSGTVVPSSAGRLQYTCARYGAASIESARAQLAAGERSLRVLERCGAIEVIDDSVWAAVAPPEVFSDLDTPDDLARFGM